jgi:hypothetical protein
VFLAVVVALSVPANARAIGYGCEATANAPYKNNGLVGGSGSTLCAFVYNDVYLKVCLQVRDNTAGWISLTCAQDTRTGVVIGSIKGYGLLAVSTCYNPNRGIMYRTWVATGWYHYDVGGWTWTYDYAVTGAVYINCGSIP